MAEYDGTIELLDEQGEPIAQVHAHLLSYQRGGLSDWSGHIHSTPLNGDDWMAATRIRLPDGREGDIVMTNNHVSASATGAIQTGEMQGSGPAPFSGSSQS